MASEDTVKLLKECNAGVKMAVTSIEEILDHVKSEDLKLLLIRSKDAHEEIGNRTHIILNELYDNEKDPNPMAKAMSWLKTNYKMLTNETDAEVADLMTEGCNMGIKSLNRYLNQYPNSDDRVRKMTVELIEVEDRLVRDLRAYL